MARTRAIEIAESVRCGGRKGGVGKGGEGERYARDAASHDRAEGVESKVLFKRRHGERYGSP